MDAIKAASNVTFAINGNFDTCATLISTYRFLPMYRIVWLYILSRFNAKSTMQAHVKIEHENHRQVCHVCAKEYRTLHSLQLHLRSHSNKGPRLKCRTCGNMFMNMYRLRLHQAQEHEHAKLLQCPHCPRKKTNTFELRKHITHSHKFKVHKCELCEREFRSPIDVQVGWCLPTRFGIRSA